MKYRTHVIGGMLIGLAGAKGLDVMSQAVLMSTATLGSLVPDIDHRGSYIGRRAKITSAVASSVFKHRGATHSPILVSALMFATKFLTISPIIELILLGLYLGIMSHIFLDMLTKGGVPLLYPLSKKKYSLTNIKTGSFYETIIMFIMIVILLMIIITGG